MGICNIVFQVPEELLQSRQAEDGSFSVTIIGEKSDTIYQVFYFFFALKLGEMQQFIRFF